MMVGYWAIGHDKIFEAFVSGRPLELDKPDNIDGPGCIECGRHWTAARSEPCVPTEDA